MRAWMSIAPPGGLGTTSVTLRLGKVWANPESRKTRKKRVATQRRGSIKRIVNSPIHDEVRACEGRAVEARRRNPAAALAAEARTLFALRHAMARRVVGPRADPRVPRRAQGRRVAQDLLSRGVRR